MPTRTPTAAALLAALLTSAARAAAPAQTPADSSASLPVTITVDAAKPIAPLAPIWKYCGYDEPNYTYTPNGKKLIEQFSHAGPGPAYFRTHSLLVTGDGTPHLKWGSTNAYTEDPSGKPIYNFEIIDKIFDTYREFGSKPLVQIGFTPKALSPKPEPYEHHWKPGDNYNDIYLGWAYPPNDLDKWSALIKAWAAHSIEKYGKTEVESWPWEVWNEPNIGYFKGKLDDYNKLYDATAKALKSVDPNLKIGGPESTGPGGSATTFLKGFLDHVRDNKVPLDIVTFHAKGNPTYVQNHVRMGVSNQLRNIDAGFQIVASYPQFKNLPIIIGESDPDGCAACAGPAYPQNGYRNGTLFASYTAEQIARTFQLADKHGVNIHGAVTWAFQFEDQPLFAGFRALATNGIELPVVNTHRMLGKMIAPDAQRISATSSADPGVDAIRTAGVRGAPDVSALATKDAHRLCILLWNYHDDDVPGPTAHITLTVNNTPAGKPTVARYQVDDVHSNSFTAWKKMGSPATLTPAQRTDLEKSAALAQIDAPALTNNTLTLDLPRQAVTLIELTYP
jgi:xylan 1,4-beta-xylosidase